MDAWLRTSLDVIIIPFINLTSGVIGGLVGSLIGWIGKNDTFRWFISYALIGILYSFIYARYVGTIELMFQPQLDIFVPLFTIIGLVWSGIFKYRIDNVDWQLLLLFPLVGLVAAVLYQSRGSLLWFAVLGAVSGGIIWYLTNARLSSAVSFAGMSAILTLVLLSKAHTYISGLLNFTLGGLIGGFAGWFIQNKDIKWVIMIGILGALTGGAVEFIASALGLLPILIGGVVGGLFGLVIEAHSQSKMITFIIFGSVFFCALKLGWDTIQIYESIGPLL